MVLKKVYDLKLYYKNTKNIVFITLLDFSITLSHILYQVSYLQYLF